MNRDQRPLILWYSYETLFSTLQERYQQAEKRRGCSSVFGDSQAVIWLVCDADVTGEQIIAPREGAQDSTGDSMKTNRDHTMSEEDIILQFPEQGHGRLSIMAQPIIRASLRPRLPRPVVVDVV